MKHGRGLEPGRQRELIKTFSANWDYRVVRQVRDIINADTPVDIKVRELDDYVNRPV
jgi:hypothetical protein